MQTTHNTVLITGGSAGIGLAIARLLSQHNNHVIITGRDPERLKAAAAGLENVTPVVCDVTKEKDVDRLVQLLHTSYPNTNILINNAGKAIAYQLSSKADAFEKAADEILTNYLSVISLTEKLLPLLHTQPDAAIVNVTSIGALVPSYKIPTYTASKAALRSYTQSLRLTLAATGNIRVFELMPPLVNTDFSREIGGSKGIPPEAVADALLEALGQDIYEIHVGATAQLYELLRTSPADALRAMNPA
ncbi:SDR family oxidoreductase [Chitinophaga nivalis]|uniref:SDR family NAD(P)-dependent oxidoreductase n=1 Tax=Chitinophaga nivalis TaxID=2991709 RepID=A0ABT3INA3_9BACT|nr:SDR family NAD(P)-dependent oxidoreductase [Chitinophaga nivalis]MCW3465109.1 SDR family NAD(P)-dependent oxidoreductase [Chitinophaga nivalis]MCW3485199.1 SDR family NAD(P)-dependent oxidoreductase [Chitinophaga nivalis]